MTRLSLSGSTDGCEPKVLVNVADSGAKPLLATGSAAASVFGRAAVARTGSAALAAVPDGTTAPAGVPPVFSYLNAPPAAGARTQADPPPGQASRTLPRWTDAPGWRVIFAVLTPAAPVRPARGASAAVMTGVPPLVVGVPSSSTDTLQAGPFSGQRITTLPRSTVAPGWTVNVPPVRPVLSGVPPPALGIPETVGDPPPPRQPDKARARAAAAAGREKAHFGTSIVEGLSSLKRPREEAP